MLASRLALAVAGSLTLMIAQQSTADAPAAVAQSEERPNVLVIVTDDQSANPASAAVMPRTTKLFGRGGTTFTNAVATTPLCCPSRASIMSGRYAHNHRVTKTTNKRNLDLAATLQHELHEAGYLTAMAGKFLNGWGESNPPDFDRWALMRVGSVDRYYDVPFNVDGTKRIISRYSTSFIRRRAVRAVRWFEERDDTPWYLYLAPYAPHAPATPQAKYRDAPVPEWTETGATREHDLGDKPAHVQEAALRTRKEAVSAFRARQLRTLLSVDDLVAKLFSEIEALDESNTLAFFISDNGFLWYEHHLVGKRHPYDSSVEVPFAARWPGHLPAGGRDERIAANIDLAPTAYDAAGIAPSYQADGRSLLRARAREHILLEYWNERIGPPVPSWSAWWTPARQYIEYADGTLEYYGPQDPWQRHNLFGNDIDGDEPEDADELATQLEADRSCVGNACP
jgi:arylsulfatase A-like enzyme